VSARCSRPLFTCQTPPQPRSRDQPTNPTRAHKHQGGKGGTRPAELMSQGPTVCRTPAPATPATTFPTQNPPRGGTPGRTSSHQTNRSGSSIDGSTIRAPPTC
jgi:hypothetical protein